MHNQDLKFVYRTCCNSVFWCFRLTFVLILFSFSYLSRCLLQLNSCCRGHSSQKKKEAIGQNEKRWKKGEKTFFGPRMLHFKNGRQKNKLEIEAPVYTFREVHFKYIITNNSNDDNRTIVLCLVSSTYILSFNRCVAQPPSSSIDEIFFVVILLQFVYIISILSSKTCVLQFFWRWCRCLFVKAFIVQCNPINVITLGPHIFDHIN